MRSAPACTGGLGVPLALRAIHEACWRSCSACLAGLLLVLIFPWYDVEWLAWVAFVPLLMATRGVRLADGVAVGVDQRLCGLSGHSALDSAHDDQLRWGSHAS